MLHYRSAMLGGIVGFTVALSAVGFVGCRRDKEGADPSAKPAAATSPAQPAQTPEELSTPLAKVDEEVITIGEFQDRINRQSPYIRGRYTSVEMKKEFLDNLIRFEVLAKEGFRRGLDKDPEVIRTMKQVMIQKLMKAEFEDKISPESITDAEMKAFYDSHQGEYNRPEEVRASAIILKSKAEADKVAKEAMGEAGKSNNGFRQLVSTHSTDETTKLRGGDLRYFDRESKEVPKPVVEATFALQNTGDVAGPIDAGNGTFYVIKMTGRRKAVAKTFEDVKRQIQNRLYREKRTEAQKQFIEGLKAKAQITINEENLDKVRVDTSDLRELPVPAVPADMLEHGGGEIPALGDVPMPAHQH